jgi:hypothetical protein
LLGRYNPGNAKQFRIVIDKEFRNKPVENEPLVLIVSRGEVLIGTPFRLGNAIAFDLVETIRRTFYELDDKDRRTKKRRQQRYLATRYMLRFDENNRWSFDSAVMVHSAPEAVGIQGLRGTVNWLKQGVQLNGIGTDNTFTADGRSIPVAVHAQIALIRAGDELYIEDTWQDYHLGVDPAGNELPYPDFSRPVGEPDSWFSRKVSSH